MWKVYKYIYYRLYVWNRRMWGSNDIPQYNAMLEIALLTFLNIFSLPFLIEALTGIRILEFPKIPKDTFILLFFAFIFIHYFLLVYKNKYQDIEKEFKKESNYTKRKRGYLILFYVLSSIVILFVSWYGIYLRNR